ncbi:MAG: hypothetical protein ACK5RS_01390, partial [Acidobacteriota bacterium]
MQSAKSRQKGQRRPRPASLIILLLTAATLAAQPLFPDAQAVPASGLAGQAQLSTSRSLLTIAREAAGGRLPRTLRARGSSRRFVRYVAVK